jgi:hypothetical protein
MKAHRPRTLTDRASQLAPQSALGYFPLPANESSHVSPLDSLLTPLARLRCRLRPSVYTWRLLSMSPVFLGRSAGIAGRRICWAIVSARGRTVGRRCRLRVLHHKPRCCTITWAATLTLALSATRLNGERIERAQRRWQRAPRVTFCGGTSPAVSRFRLLYPHRCDFNWILGA